MSEKANTMTKEQATREALRMALEALEYLEEHLPFDWAFDELQSLAGKDDYRQSVKEARDLIPKIKEALAQPEHTTEYKRGYADAMNWKVQNHLEHLPTAQPEQEPTPTPNEGFEGSIRIFLKKSDGQWERLEKLEQMHEYNKQQWAQPEQELTNLERHERNVQRLFGTPQPKEPEQEPPVVAELLCVCGAEWEWRNRDWELVSTPPQRTWVGLTEMEKAHMAGWYLAEQRPVKDLMHLVESKLKEKNTYDNQ